MEPYPSPKNFAFVSEYQSFEKKIYTNNTVLLKYINVIFISIYS